VPLACRALRAITTRSAAAPFEPEDCLVRLPIFLMGLPSAALPAPEPARWRARFTAAPEGALCRIRIGTGRYEVLQAIVFGG
jgi:hypothetical protein